MVFKFVKWAFVAGALLGFSCVLLFAGYGFSRGYDVPAGLRHLIELDPAPVYENPKLKDVEWQQVTWLADIENRALNESSGLTASNLHEDILYSINDSGSDPLLFAVDLSGRHRGTWRIDVPEAVDWEAMDALMLDGKPYVMIADTGDNLRWRNQVSLLIVPEPERLGVESELLPVFQQIELSYPDQAHDVEAVAVDAQAGQVYLLTKRHFPHKFYRVPLEFERPVTAELVTSVETLPQPDPLDFEALEGDAKYRHMPTGMDIAGDHLVVTTLKHAYLFDRNHFTKPPTRIRLPSVGQREAITFAAGSDDTLYFSRERFQTVGDADLYELVLGKPTQP